VLIFYHGVKIKTTGGKMKKSIQFLFAMSIFILFSLAYVNAGIMTRTGPTSATPGQSFTITYTATATGTWGASIEDSVSGGCLFPSGSSTYKSVMLSTDGSTKSITITAPSSGTCVFSGNSQFGTDSILNFNPLTVTIGSGTCTPSCSGKTCGSDGCSGTCGTCTSSQTCQSGTCVTGTCIPNCVGKCGGVSDGCSGTCTASCGNQTTCSSGQELCSDGTCKNTGTCGSNGFDLSFLTKVIWTINGFGITVWMLIVGGIVLLLLIGK
jgi:hypothetical protein